MKPSTNQRETRDASYGAFRVPHRSFHYSTISRFRRSSDLSGHDRARKRSVDRPICCACLCHVGHRGLGIQANPFRGRFLCGRRRHHRSQNGLALAGAYISAASFVGISGLVYLAGFGGLIYSVGSVVGWPMVAILLVEPLCNLGRFTVADASRFDYRKPLFACFPRARLYPP
jgi:hypothetical protein